ncbi:K+-transporting ATPase, KdpA [Longilinea arvoryzae]|uniref:Potassium-transporting ATPase potassium-binding subunit n=1 Tax=Longilinea arvoryzae TaxID=360412 RepID=A0A0S7BDX3_9CHLR|nr:potassium-transporting ATPase subunit KdpA [Longilinea arvoryzae]GAP13677.1 K+-transporting ATPase, KdpA [Longilinea arvoryzae]
MTLTGWFQIILFVLVLVLLVKPVGLYMARVYQGERTFVSPILAPVERFIYRISGVHPEEEMTWKEYAVALLLFSLLGILLLFILLRAQNGLPLNPGGMKAMPSDLAFNTAVSFVTNTNWQNYGGESTLSYLSQMLGLTVQNFLSAASGLAIAMALIRAFARHNVQTLGNFWADLTRSVVYILIPLSILLAMILVSQGVVQTFSQSITANVLQPSTTSGGETIHQQVIAVGPVASQLAIKHLGTNGGGFFNANAAHPFENPNALTNFLLILAETLLPAALTYTFGRMVGDTRQGWAIFIAMMILLCVFAGFAYASESAGNPVFSKLGVDQGATNINPGGNMEGKEDRFGIAPSTLFATVTTATSTGAVDSMHDSYTPLGGLVLLLMMEFGEVVLGGVGSGLYGMLVFVIVAVFVAGLMVGRTPEYLGKKIEPFEMKMAALLILIMPIVVLGLTALASVTGAGQAAISNPGPHGFSQILYAFTSQGNNNGSAFAGLSGNSAFYNLTGAAAMLIGRFWLAIPTLALAGSLVSKKKAVPGAGTLSTTSPLFIGWLIAIVIVVGALNFVPALALGPVIEHLLMIGA